MGIITKEVEVILSGRSIKHYREKGYDVKYHELLKVKVEDLPKCSTVLVDVQCEYCGKIKSVKYGDYNVHTQNGNTKYCCSDCSHLKHQESMLEKYGYKSPLQVPEIKEKMQQTNLERYGSISPSGNEKIKEKIKSTNLKKYGVENFIQSKEAREKIKQTNLKRYGVENVLCNKEIIEKIKKTNLEKYGVENVLLAKDIKEKRDNTLIERYGTLHPLQREECLEKLKRTNIERYGVENISQSEETKQKVRQTNLERYGVENVAKSEKIMEKIKKTNLEKYGVESLLLLPSFHEHSRKIYKEKYGVYHHLQNPDILAKQKETFYKNQTCPISKQQTYLHFIYGGELNYPVYYYSVDICFPKEKLVIEYDGRGHNLAVKLGDITQEEFNQKEIIRNNVIKREGYKQMRIISTTDKLPSDEILLELLSHSKQYFSDYPNHSWIEFNIDSSSIRSAEYKEGIFFDYGKLRRITDKDIENLAETA